MDKLHECFKAYDIRGSAPEQLNPRFASALGSALCQIVRPAKAVIGYDARLSSPGLASALAASLARGGVHVSGMGLCGTEEIYYAAANHNFDLGAMITGSHNPARENGFKLVRAGAIPIDADSGLKDIAAATISFLQATPAENPQTACASEAGFTARPGYINWLLKHADKNARPLKIAIDAGNGCAGPFLTELAKRLPHTIIPVNFQPDGAFPNGVPNPLLPERRMAASRAVVENGADFGAAFDGDFDRCFFFDSAGKMVESCYLIGHLATLLLKRHPGCAIVHDARVYWLTRELVLQAGGKPVMSRGGHTRMKETMRRENALYGAEMSAHHFYRDFAYCDSGMLTFILLANVLATGGKSLAELVADGMTRYPCSGEINFRVENAADMMERLWLRDAPKACHADRLDGINLEFPDWRYNLRSSNTEPLLRLNVESRGSQMLLEEKTQSLREFIAAI